MTNPAASANKWCLTNKFECYLDFEKELTSFSDEANTSIDMRLTFVADDANPRAAYICTMQRDDEGDSVEIGPGQINISWEEGLRLLAEDGTSIPDELSETCAVATASGSH